MNQEKLNPISNGSKAELDNQTNTQKVDKSLLEYIALCQKPDSTQCPFIPDLNYAKHR